MRNESIKRKRIGKSRTWHLAIRKRKCVGLWTLREELDRFSFYLRRLQQDGSVFSVSRTENVWRHALAMYGASGNEATKSNNKKSNRGEEQAASKIEKAELLNHADYTWKIWKYPTYSTRQGPLSWKIIYIIDFFDMWLVYRFSIRPMHVSRQPICGRLSVKSKLKLSSHLRTWRNMSPKSKFSWVIGRLVQSSWAWNRVYWVPWKLSIDASFWNDPNNIHFSLFEFLEQKSAFESSWHRWKQVALARCFSLKAKTSMYDQSYLTTRNPLLLTYGAFHRSLDRN